MAVHDSIRSRSKRCFVFCCRGQRRRKENNRVNPCLWIFLGWLSGSDSDFRSDLGTLEADVDASGKRVQYFAGENQKRISRPKEGSIFSSTLSSRQKNLPHTERRHGELLSLFTADWYCRLPRYRGAVPFASAINSFWSDYWSFLCSYVVDRWQTLCSCG